MKSNTYQPLDLTQDTSLRLLDVLLTADDLNLGLLMNSALLLLPAVLLLLIVLVRKVDLDAELVAELVDTRALGTDDTTNKFAINLELDGL